MLPEAEGPLEVPLTAFTLKHGGAAVTSALPALGEHNHEILTELGYDDDAIDDLRTNSVV